jgi:hypothetical protein
MEQMLESPLGKVDSKLKEMKTLSPPGWVFSKKSWTRWAPP